MTPPDRLDDLLQRALDEGRIPPDASPADRAELEQLLAARSHLTAERRAVDAEAEGSMPVARARFQRYLAAQRVQPTVEVRTVASRPAPLARLLAGRRLQLTASLVALAVLLIAALVAVRPFAGVETVQALGVDDYVQLTGTLTAATGTDVTLDTPEFGRVRVTATSAAFLDTEGNVTAGPPAVGQHVIVSGIVRDAREGRVAIEAQALALASSALPPSDGRPLAPLRGVPASPEATLAFLAIGSDDGDARAIVILADGRRALVHVDATSIGQVLGAAGSPLGTRVRLGDSDGRFSLEPLHDHDGDTRPGGHDGGRGLVRLTGTIRTSEATSLILETASGPVTIVRRPNLKVLPGESGLTIADLRRGASLDGYTATVSGGFNPATGEFIAALVVLGPRP